MNSVFLHFYFPMILFCLVHLLSFAYAADFLKSLVQRNALSETSRRAILAVYVAVNVLIVGFVFVFRYTVRINHPTAELFESGLLLAIVLIILSMIFAATCFLWKIFSLRKQPPNISRRRFLQYLISSTSLVSVPAAYSLYFERLNLETSSVTIPLQKLPKNFDDFTILQISDLHIGPYTREAYLQEMVEKINQLNTDLLIFTGDYVTHKSDFKYFPETRRALSQLKKDIRKLAILGNHDFYTDPQIISSELEALNFEVLNNAHIRISRQEEIYIIGIDDIIVKQDNFPQASRGIPPNAFKILLCHSPDFIKEASTHKIDLMLSGHTHGGQVNIPFIGPPIVPSKYNAQYAAGLIKEKDSHLYVNRGIGVINPPIRFNCRPEISRLILKKA